MDDRDFLQDPGMWEDKLPQPYKTINKILRDILKDTWTRIEEREVARVREEAQVKIPSGADGMLFNKKLLNNACAGIECGEDSMVVLGNGTSVYVLKHNRNCKEVVEEPAEKNVDVEIVSELNLRHSISTLKSVKKNDGLVIMAQLEAGM